MAIKDADNQAEYCLECIKKHLDTSLSNLDEIEQRLIYNPEPDKKVRKKVESIIRDLEAAEQHALDTQNTTTEERGVLGEINNSLRKTRKLLEMTKLGYREDGITPVGGLADIQLAKGLMDKHIGQVHKAIAEIGCGDCDKAEAQMGLVVMRKELKKELEEEGWLGQMYAPELQEMVEKREKFETDVIIPLKKELAQPVVTVKGETIQAKASYDPATDTTMIAIKDEDVEKVQVIAQTLPTHVQEVKVEEIEGAGVTVIEAKGVGEEGVTIITEVPTIEKQLQPRKTLVQRIIEQRAKECKVKEEPQVCLTIAANEIRDLKIQRGDTVIPSTAQLLDTLNEEMKK